MQGRAAAWTRQDGASSVNGTDPEQQCIKGFLALAGGRSDLVGEALLGDCLDAEGLAGGLVNGSVAGTEGACK